MKIKRVVKFEVQAGTRTDVISDIGFGGKDFPWERFGKPGIRILKLRAMKLKNEN